MKTPEEGYALGWADAIYAYESKKRKQMSKTVDDLRGAWASLSRVQSDEDTYDMKSELICQVEELQRERDGCRYALLRLQEEVERLRASASPPKRKPLAGCSDLRDAKWLDPECCEAGACQSLRFKNKREPLTEREIKDICHMNGWDDSYQSMRFARAIERAHGIGDE